MRARHSARRRRSRSLRKNGFYGLAPHDPITNTRSYGDYTLDIEGASDQEPMTGAQTTSPVSPADKVTEVVEHFFSHESAKMTSTLTRIIDLEHLNRAEDVVQETLIRAIQTWPYNGIPKNPSAWMTQVAKNLALD